MIKIINNCEKTVVFEDLPNKAIFKYGKNYYMKILSFNYFIQDDEEGYMECEINAVCINGGAVTCFRDNEEVTPFEDAKLILK